LRVFASSAFPKKNSPEALLFRTQWKKDDLVVELRMAELKATSAGRAQRSTPAPSMRVALADLVSLKASDVGMTDLAVGPSRGADGFTDGGITRGEHRERELVAWAPAAGEEALGGIEDGGGLLEDPAMKAKGGGWGGRGAAAAAAQWDQFAANKSMFGVDTSFDETMYTTAIDKSAGGISEAEAARIAREIQNSVSTNVHMQEERGQRMTVDYDEEDLYGAVVGTGAAAGGAHAAGKGGAVLPNKPAWGSSKVPEGVRALADQERKRSGSPPAPRPVPAPADAKTAPAPAAGATAAAGEEKPKSTLSASAKPFSLSAKAAEFTPSFAKKPAAPAAPPRAAPGTYPGAFPGGLPPAMMMGGYPQYPQMPGFPPRGVFPPHGAFSGAGGRAAPEAAGRRSSKPCSRLPPPPPQPPPPPPPDTACSPRRPPRHASGAGAGRAGQPQPVSVWRNRARCPRRRTLGGAPRFPLRRSTDRGDANRGRLGRGSRVRRKNKKKPKIESSARRRQKALLLRVPPLRHRPSGVQRIPPRRPPRCSSEGSYPARYTASRARRPRRAAGASHPRRRVRNRVARRAPPPPPSEHRPVEASAGSAARARGARALGSSVFALAPSRRLPWKPRARTMPWIACASPASRGPTSGRFRTCC
jgi:hypothetical protein